MAANAIEQGTAIGQVCAKWRNRHADLAPCGLQHGVRSAFNAVYFTLEGEMVSPTDLKKGSAYYMLTFADRDWTIPGVEPMIYVGVNVLDSQRAEAETHYCFQDTVSFSRFGDATQYKGPANLADEGASIRSLTARQLSTDVFTLEGVIAEMQAARARANAKSRET